MTVSTGFRGLVGVLASQPGDPVGLRDAVVVGVTESGTVNLDMGILIDDVPCLSSYTGRRIDDVVAVLVVSRRMLVIGKIGEEDAGSSFEETDVLWGAGAPPGTGWVKSASGNVYAQDHRLYVRTVTATTTEPDDPAPPAPPPVTPRPVFIDTTDEAAFRDGRLDDGERWPVQGAWSSYPHPYTGAWYYGTKLRDACVGKSVAKMEMKVTRQGRGSGGVYGGARTRLFLHEETSHKSTPPDLSSAWSPTTLTPGETDWLLLPASWTSALASGSSRGVGCRAEVGNDYLKYGDCGMIKISFN